MMDNPKHIQALKDGKAPLEYLVTTMFELDAAVHKHGADKYGKLNWRIDKITATTYVAAMLRHLKAWIEGQDMDPESLKPHLTHLRACCAVVLDAQMHGTLIDDRLRMESKSVKVEQFVAAAAAIDAQEVPQTERIVEPYYDAAVPIHVPKPEPEPETRKHLGEMIPKSDPPMCNDYKCWC
jgi:hypothetical protein